MRAMVNHRQSGWGCHEAWCRGNQRCRRQCETSAARDAIERRCARKR
jgi:hypothetical protein